MENEPAFHILGTIINIKQKIGHQKNIKNPFYIEVGSKKVLRMISLSVGRG